MTIGIDKIGFATSPYVLRLEDLATARDTDPEKLSKGLLLKNKVLHRSQKTSSHWLLLQQMIF